MGDATLEPTLDDLRRLNASAEPGVWWVDDFKVEDGHGPHKAYALANRFGKHICDTVNGDLQLIEQDDGPRYDSAGSANLEFAAACVNYVRSLIVAEAQASAIAAEDAQREIDDNGWNGVGR